MIKYSYLSVLQIFPKCKLFNGFQTHSLLTTFAAKPFDNTLCSEFNTTRSSLLKCSNQQLVRSFSSITNNNCNTLLQTKSTLQPNIKNLSNNSSSIPAQLWKLGRLNHVAIAVPDLEAATSFYRDVLGATVSAPQQLPSHGVTTVFIELDNTKLELLHPLGDNSPIAKFLLKNKSGGMHHVCLEVDDIESAMAAVTAAGIRCLSKTTKIGAHGKPVVFLHPADCNGVLTELEQA